ncbi:MAG: undecaprenyldiphospho-muramoylpentapeptide beta-N-acetylglucosaminyltransferase [Deltaproteobacteria bacterium]|nr:undecaprenyldiphospho-muramoylpentapeptide beta-N-acetylglucosaminyltransferase [Deltaproteobacteria bacterium]MBW2360144.1 undecaprenyldiphospho-muramoylpentapeptide beta-N-acetylglucosaminyltransferase [Deltaproteobacteria bacterium]
MSQRWVVAGGGTGGHVTPALALAERIRERGDDVLVMGGRLGLESKLVPQAGFELVALPARQLMGQGFLGRLAALPALAAACFAAWRELGRRNVEIVVSVGGYASVPAVAAAVLRRLPIALVEPNAIPGRANLAAARFARRVFLGFEAAAASFGPSGREPARVCGIPLRRALLEVFASQAERRTPAAPFRLLVFGGSQGARQLNDAMIEAAPALGRHIQIFHQTGPADQERVTRAYAAAGVQAEVVAFEPDMPGRYAWADLALCRSGALTVAELALAGLPALLVPYPYAADDHQRANARALADAGAGRLLDTPLGALAGVLQGVFESPGELVAMGRKARALARPDAAERIVAECAALLADEGED